VASSIAALAAALQSVVRYRRNEQVKRRGRLLRSELATLDAIRRRVEASPDPGEAETLMRDAHDVLADAERDAAAGLLDAQGIASLRSLHHVCWLSMRQRRPARGPHASEKETAQAPMG
jgi:chemotaxis protein histidine kinase CheA